MREVLLAGEMGPYENSRLGCVGYIYSLIAGKIPVRGAAGCIYPLMPYREWIGDEFRRKCAAWGGTPLGFFERMEKMMANLYENAVSV